MEYFNKFDTNKITIRPNKKKIIHKGHRADYRSIYGSFEIDSNCNKLIWVFKIHKIGESVSIGIDSSNGQYINSYFYRKKGTYAYEASGSAWNNGVENKKYGDKYGKDDTVTMIYNGSESTLTFTRETSKMFGGSKMKTYEPIKISNKKKYHICVCLYGKGGTVELTDFIKDSDYDDEKTKGISDEGSAPQNDKDQEIISLKTENRQLRQEILSLRQDMKELEQRMANTTRRNTALEDEQKQLVLQNETLRVEIQTLRVSSIDMNDYQHWEAKQIISWIMSLENGRFKQYEQTLTESFKEEGIDGSCLKEIDRGDIKGWGVALFNDKKDLAKYIQNLVSQQNIYMPMEGAVVSGGHYR